MVMQKKNSNGEANNENQSGTETRKRMIISKITFRLRGCFKDSALDRRWLVSQNTRSGRLRNTVTQSRRLRHFEKNLCVSQIAVKSYILKHFCAIEWRVARPSGEFFFGIRFSDKLLLLLNFLLCKKKSRCKAQTTHANCCRRSWRCAEPGLHKCVCVYSFSRISFSAHHGKLRSFVCVATCVSSTFLGFFYCCLRSS